MVGVAGGRMILDFGMRILDLIAIQNPPSKIQNRASPSGTPVATTWVSLEDLT
jgi:hypothetical protein